MTTPADRAAANAGEGLWASERRQLSRCELFDSVAAELALGSLTGIDRSSALAHLEECESCEALVKDLSATADALLLAAPEVDPPAGFEVRWLARIPTDAGAVVPVAGPIEPAPIESARSRHRFGTRTPRRLLPAIAAATVALLVGGAGIAVGLAVAQQPRSLTAVGQIRLAALRSGSSYLPTGGPTVGEAAVASGNPSWVVMTYQRPGWSGRVECVVIEHGRAEEVGSFWIYDGSASWSVRLASPGAAVTSAEVRSPSGAVLATATFSG